MNQINKIKRLTNQLLQYCHEYYDLDSPTISDAEYDKKYSELEKLETEANFWLANSPTKKVQGETLPYLTKVKHSVPMLSADKSTNIEDVIKFKGDKMITASYKLDGATVVLKFNNGRFIQALSRGSGIEGEDITHTAKMIKNIPITIPYKDYLEIRGEALIPWKYYKEMNVNGDMGHPRNVASGGLRQLSANEASKRNIYFYAFTLVNWKDVVNNTNCLPLKSDTLNFLSNNGFDVVPHYNVPAFDRDNELQKIISLLNREDYELPTDGWCFEYSNLEYGDSLGSTEHHDRRLFALKPEIEEHVTTFRGVDYNTCRTGIVSLTATFDPIEIANTTVSRATLHNVDIFNSLEFGEGDKISVAKFNEIIPGIVDNLTRSGTYKLIDKCPSCGAVLEIKNTGTAHFLYCPNEECSAKHLALFEHFVSKKAMNIDGMSSSTLSFLINKGWVKKYADLYHLDQYADRWARCEGFGKKSVEKLLAAIEKSRNVDLAHFITALSIPNIGSTASKTIAEYFHGDHYDFVQALAKGFDFTQLKDFGEIMNKSLHDWWDSKDSMAELLPMEMHFVVEENKTIKNDFINGKTFCVTGAFNTMKRSEIEELITERGGKLSGSVSAKTDYLLTNEANSGSSKAKKAAELGTPIMSEDEFIKMIGE